MNGEQGVVPGRRMRDSVLSAVTLVLCALHAALVLMHYPWSSLRSAYPLSSGDLSLHFSAAYSGRQFIQEGGGIWGYAPDFMAGYPFGVWDSFTQRGYEYCSLLFPGLPLVTAFHAYLILTALLPPFLVGLAARILCLGRLQVLLSLCIAVVLYQLDDTLAYFWTFGNIGFPFVNAVGVLYLACLARGLRDLKPGFLVCAGLLLAAVGWLHQMVVLPVAAGSLWVLASEGRDLLRQRRLLWAMVVPSIAVLVLMPWFAALWHFRDLRVPRETPALVGGAKNLIMDFLSDRAYRHHFDRRALFHVQFVLAAVGAFLGYQTGRRSIAALWAAGISALGFAYFFSYSQFFKETEPYRFVVSFALLAAIPAAVGLERLAELFRRADCSARLVTVLLGLILAPSLTAYTFDIVKREAAQMPSAASRAVLDWFQGHEGGRGRLFCLDTTLGDILPHYGGQAMLGGGMTRVSPLANKAAWKIGHAMFMDPAGLPSVAAVDAYLRQYNIAHVVLPSERWDALMARVPGCSLAFLSGRTRVYVRAPEFLSYVVGQEGSGSIRVDAHANRIVMNGAPTGRFILKYHYQDTLQAPPGIRLFPASVQGDPVPFIGVENPSALTSMEITNTGHLF